MILELGALGLGLLGSKAPSIILSSFTVHHPHCMLSRVSFVMKQKPQHSEPAWLPCEMLPCTTVV